MPVTEPIRPRTAGPAPGTVTPAPFAVQVPPTSENLEILSARSSVTYNVSTPATPASRSANTYPNALPLVTPGNAVIVCGANVGRPIPTVPTATVAETEAYNCPSKMFSWRVAVLLVLSWVDIVLPSVV